MAASGRGNGRTSSWRRASSSDLWKTSRLSSDTLGVRCSVPGGQHDTLLMRSLRLVVAAGRPPPGGRGQFVCYHTNDVHDYAELGHAEAVQVAVDKDASTEQAAELFRDFFASFTGPDGARQRPDPQDMGPPYRSLVGLPGGVNSPLYALLEHANVHKMALKPSIDGSDPDEFNTVWVMDSDSFPFWAGEVYHQFHCNFFYSEGMPYPEWYWNDLWLTQQQACRIAPTGCPEDHPLTPHPGQLCAAYS